MQVEGDCRVLSLKASWLGAEEELQEAKVLRAYIVEGVWDVDASGVGFPSEDVCRRAASGASWL